MYKFQHIIIFIMLSCFSSMAFGVIEFKSNMYFSLLTSNGTDLLARSFNSLYVGGGGFHLGAVYLHDPLHDYVTDTGYGAGIRFGEKSYLEIVGGYYERDFDGLIGKGFFAVISPGIHLSNVVGFSVPIIVKKISSGRLDKRMMVDVLPYLGLRLSF